MQLGRFKTNVKILSYYLVFQCLIDSSHFVIDFFDKKFRKLSEAILHQTGQ